MENNRYQAALDKAWVEFKEKFPAIANGAGCKDCFEIGFGNGSSFGVEVGKTLGVASVGRVETEVRDAERS